MMSSASCPMGGRAAGQWPPVRRPKGSMVGRKAEITPPLLFLPESELSGSCQKIRVEGHVCHVHQADSRGRNPKVNLNLDPSQAPGLLQLRVIGHSSPTSPTGPAPNPNRDPFMLGYANKDHDQQRTW